MRVNRTTAMTTTSYQIGSLTNSPPAASNCASVTCNGTQLATYDKAQWITSIFTQLPNGQGAVTYQDAGSTRIYTIEIRWTDVEWDDTQNAKEGLVPDCFDNRILEEAFRALRAGKHLPDSLRTEEVDYLREWLSARSKLVGQVLCGALLAWPLLVGGASSGSWTNSPLSRMRLTPRNTNTKVATSNLKMLTSATSPDARS